MDGLSAEKAKEISDNFIPPRLKQELDLIFSSIMSAASSGGYSVGKYRSLPFTNYDELLKVANRVEKRLKVLGYHIISISHEKHQNDFPFFYYLQVSWEQG